jgi:transposase-like protein
MAQHFLVSAASRTMSLKDIYGMGDAKAYEAFCKLRWPETDGEAVCPRCGGVEAYKITTRRRFKCAACLHQYSVTSGTIFSARKMSFTDLLASICIFSNAVKGISALQLARDIGCNAKTAFVMAHKIREALATEIEGATVEGECEIDGAFFGGSIRPANLKENRVDRRRVQFQTGKRRVVIVVRERNGRTLPFVSSSEAHGVYIAKRVVKPGSTMFADEASHWDALHSSFKTLRINHSEAYSLNGACTNQAESYFSRLRRMIEGQHHHVSAHYLSQYANEASWKEDHRRSDNGTLTRRALGLALASPVSRAFAGYWHRSVA